MKSILSKSFKYIPAAATDVGATIRKEQRRLAKLAQLQAKHPVVTQIKRREQK